MPSRALPILLALTLVSAAGLLVYIACNPRHPPSARVLPSHILAAGPNHAAPVSLFSKFQELHAIPTRVNLTSESAQQRPEYEALNAILRKYHDVVFYRNPRIKNERPFYSMSQFPQLENLLKFLPTVRRECLALLRPSYMQRVGATLPLEQAQRGWEQLWLMQEDSWNRKICRMCPITWGLLRKIPCRREALISVLQPGASIYPHVGTGNCVLRVQVPLLVRTAPSPDCALQCGPEVRQYDASTPIIFDDSLLHSAWNYTQHKRIVLIFDIRHPDLDSDKQCTDCFREHSEQMNRIPELRALFTGKPAVSSHI